MTNKYYSPQGGLPPQTQIMTDRAMFTDAYAVIPKGTYSDIVTSFLPFWTGMRMWVIARPMSGFAETFSHYIVELTSEGGSDRPEDDDLRSQQVQHRCSHHRRGEQNKNSLEQVYKIITRKIDDYLAANIYFLSFPVSVACCQIVRSLANYIF